ncbi:MAG: hypothetical protein IIA27_16360 [Gemmatimonadetes bacterium]|nr:hypothetical protein [Gemmatimonadota bacterium]
MKIAVMGSGGIGSCYGGLLARAGCDVTLIARGAHLRAIQKNGLQLDRQDERFTIQVPATDDPSEVGPVDLVLLTVKTYHNQQAVPTLQPMVGAQTTVLCLQNGIDSYQLAAYGLADENVVPGAAYIEANLESPGQVRQTGAVVKIVLGEADGVAVPSKVDFVFRPATTLPGALPIALFTDGFMYHKSRIGLDLAQRAALGRVARVALVEDSLADAESGRHRPGLVGREHHVPGGPGAAVAAHRALEPQAGLAGALVRSIEPVLAAHGEPVPTYWNTTSVWSSSRVKRFVCS